MAQKQYLNVFLGRGLLVLLMANAIFGAQLTQAAPADPPDTFSTAGASPPCWAAVRLAATLYESDGTVTDKGNVQGGDVWTGGATLSGLTYVASNGVSVMTVITSLYRTDPAPGEACEGELKTLGGPVISPSRLPESGSFALEVSYTWCIQLPDDPPCGANTTGASLSSFSIAPADTPEETPTPTDSASVSPEPSPTEPSPSVSASTLVETITDTVAAVVEPVRRVVVPAVIAAREATGEVTAKVLEPAAATAAGVALVTVPFLLPLSTIFLAGWTGFLELLGLRRRRYPWGTVFAVGNDRPLELAIVRLKEATGRLVETRVTDRAGRFGFLAHPGSFMLEVAKPDYETVPAAAARGSRYQPVYDGRTFEIREQSTAIQANLPLKPTAGHPGFHIGQLHRPALLATLPVAIWNVTIDPTAVTIGLAVVVLIVLVTEWAVLRPRGLGRVLGVDGKPAADVVLQLVQIKEGDMSKVAATTTTDTTGHYSFLARPGTYKLRVTSSAGQPPTSLAERTWTITNPTGGVIRPTIRLLKNSS